jgi:hypothetical protein
MSGNPDLSLRRAGEVSCCCRRRLRSRGVVDGLGGAMGSSAAQAAGCRGEVRSVLSPPLLTRIPHDHLRQLGTAGCSATCSAVILSSRLSRGVRTGRVRRRSWRPSTRHRSHDHRHACVSTWLAAGMPSTQCAEWAVAVLPQIYVKVIGGLEAAAHRRIEEALGWEPETRTQIGDNSPDSAGPNRTEPGSP